MGRMCPRSGLIFCVKLNHHWLCPTLAFLLQSTGNDIEASPSNGIAAGNMGLEPARRILLRSGIG